MDTLPPKPVAPPRSPSRENSGRHDADSRDRDSGRRSESSYRDTGGRRDDRSDRRYDDRSYSSRPRQDAEPYRGPRYPPRSGPDRSRRDEPFKGRGRGYGRRDYDGRGSDSRSSWSRRDEPPDGWSRSGGRDDRDRDRDRDRGEYHRDDDRRRRDGPSSHDGRHREPAVDSWVPDSRRSDYGDRQRRSRSPPPRRRPSSPPPPRSPSDSRYSRPKSPGHYSSPLWRPPPRDDTPPPRTSPPRTTVKQEEHRTVPPLKEEPMLPAIVRHSVNSNEPLDVKPSPIKQEPAVRGRSPTPIKTEPTPAPLPPKKEYPSDPPANVVNARPVDDRTEDNDVKMKDQSEPSIPTHPRQHLRTTNLDRIQSPHSRLDSPSGSSHPNQRRPSPPRFNRQVSDRHPRYDGPPNRPNKPYHHKHEPGKIHPQLASAELNYIFPLKFEEPIPLPPDVQQLQARREQLRKSALIVYRQRAALELVELQLVNALDAENLASIDVAAAKSRQRAIDQTLAALEAATTSESSSSSGQPPGAAADATLATAVS
ncbi:hypothetical protein AB1N83_001657 [Pleurotus pulmonarius]